MQSCFRLHRRNLKRFASFWALTQPRSQCLSFHHPNGESKDTGKEDWLDVRANVFIGTCFQFPRTCIFGSLLFKSIDVSELYNSLNVWLAPGKMNPSPTLWLATKAGKMQLRCLLGTTRRVLHNKISLKVLFYKYFSDKACPVKMAAYCLRV